LLEKLKSKIPKFVFLQNPHKILELDFGYVVGTSLFRFCALHKVVEGIFLYKLSCDIDKSA
jgi:hypothetical protein